MTHPEEAPTRAKMPPGLTAYAIGDLHGRRDLLEGAIAALRDAARTAVPGTRTIAVFLGDYVDRGPESREVIEELIRLREAGPCETIFLRGNHEQFILDIVDGLDDGRRWLGYGGRDTLASYGVALSADPRRAGKLQATIRTALPPAHVDFLRSTELMARFGDYVFAHAGLRPDRLVEEQANTDLLWFRYRDDERPVHPHTVVHGHSPHALPVVGRWRIGIDTGAYASGALTLLRLEGDRRDFLKVIRPEAEPAARLEPWEATASAYQATQDGRTGSSAEASKPDVVGRSRRWLPFRAAALTPG